MNEKIFFENFDEAKKNTNKFIDFFQFDFLYFSGKVVSSFSLQISQKLAGDIGCKLFISHLNVVVQSYF